MNENFQDISGCEHKIRSKYCGGLYIVYLDGKLYATADDRMEVFEIIRDIKSHYLIA